MSENKGRMMCGCIWDLEGPKPVLRILCGPHSTFMQATILPTPYREGAVMDHPSNARRTDNRWTFDGVHWWRFKRPGEREQGAGSGEGRPVTIEEQHEAAHIVVDSGDENLHQPTVQARAMAFCARSEKHAKFFKSLTESWIEAAL